MRKGWPIRLKQTAMRPAGMPLSAQAAGSIGGAQGPVDEGWWWW